MERTPVGTFTSISDFMANYLDIHKFMFVVSIGEEFLQNELNNGNTNMSPEDFLEDIFSSVVTFEEPAKKVPEPKPIANDNDDLFAPPVGLICRSSQPLSSSLITHCSTPHPRKGSMTSADLAKSRHRTSDDPPRGRSRSTSGDLPNPYWNLGSPPQNLPRRGRGPSTDLADLRAQISSISNPPVSIDDTADCNLELRVAMSVT